MDELELEVPPHLLAWTERYSDLSLRQVRIFLSAIMNLTPLSNHESILWDRNSSLLSYEPLHSAFLE